MRIVLTVFAPLLVAIGIRLILFLLGFILSLLGFLIEEFITSYTFGNIVDYLEFIATFDTFDFEESWFYWILVIIGSFIAEYIIWSED